MKIYTKTGDSGDTSLLSGKRTRKCDLRIEMVGEIDEFSAYLGLLKFKCHDETYKAIFEKIQSELINISGYFVSLGDGEAPHFKYIEDENKILDLEIKIDEIEKAIVRDNRFVLYGDCELSVFADIAKTVCRRCERRIYALDNVYSIIPFIKKYFNRLSDFLYCYARLCDFNHKNHE